MGSVQISDPIAASLLTTEFMAGAFDAKRFTEIFPILVDANGSSNGLREMILELAVRGNLVERDPSEECASKLLERVARDQHEAARRGDIDAPNALHAVGDDEAPHIVPAGWAWARLSQAVLTIQIGPFGSLLHKADYVAGAVPLVNPANIRDGRIEPDQDKTVSAATLKRLRGYVMRTGDVVMGRRGEMGKCAVVRDTEDGWLCGTGSLFIRPTADMSAAFLTSWLRSPTVRRHLEGESVGSTMNNLNLRVLNALVLGVPPLAEQKRIVERVDQLMGLIDELEAKQTRKHDLSTRFTKSALDALTNAEGPEEFDAAWKRVVESWEIVLDRSEKVGELRKALLDLAIHGRLTSSGARHVLAGGGFAIPGHWHWADGSAAFSFITSGSRGWAEYYSTQGPIFLRIGNLDYESIRLDLANIQHVRPPLNAEGTRTRVAPGDVLVSITGDTGMVGLVPEDIGEAYINQHIALCRPNDSVLPEFVARMLTAPSLLGRIQSAQRGIKNSLGLDDIRQLRLPIPPLEEQKRIVAKVEQLMKVCDELEAKLRRAEERAAKLVEAVVLEMVG